MNDDRLEQAEAEAPEIAHEGDDDAEPAGGDKPASSAAAPSAEAPPSTGNVIRTTSPYAVDDVVEGETFEQRDPATLHAREEGERLIH